MAKIRKYVETNEEIEGFSDNDIIEWTQKKYSIDCHKSEVSHSVTINGDKYDITEEYTKDDAGKKITLSTNLFGCLHGIVNKSPEGKYYINTSDDNDHEYYGDRELSSTALTAVKFIDNYGAFKNHPISPYYYTGHINTTKAPKYTSTSESWSWFNDSIKQAYEKYNVLYSTSK